MLKGNKIKRVYDEELLFERILNCSAGKEGTILFRINTGVNRMMAEVARAYWEHCFKGMHQHIDVKGRSPGAFLPKLKTDNETSRQHLKFIEMFEDYMEEQQSRWSSHKEKLLLYGRQNDAETEEVKLSQLKRISEIWESELTSNSGKRVCLNKEVAG